jgi:hypothetical protein
MDDYEVEVVLIVNASSSAEVRAALARSGITEGALIGEAMVGSLTVYTHGDDDE